MLRASLCAVSAMAVFSVGLANADEAQTKSDKQGKHCVHATLTQVDAQKDTITVKFVDKAGKTREKTFQLAEDIDYRDSDGKTAKLNDFRAGDDVLITQKQGKVVAMKEDDEATITKVDAKAGTVTLKMKNKDGKEVEKVFELTEDAEYIDSTGNVGTLEVFQSGDQVLIVESDGKIKELKKAPPANKSGSKGQTPGDKQRNDKTP